MSDMRWLMWICLSRLGFALINTCFSAMIPTLRIDWQMTAAESGMVQSAWHIGYVLSLVVASALTGRFGAKRTFIGMGYAACVGALSFALFADSFMSACLLYGFAGLCAGGSYVPGLALIAERFPVTTRGRAMGFYIAAASLGYAIGLVGSSTLALQSGAQSGFLLAASGTIAGLVISTLSLRGTPNVIQRHDKGSMLTSLVWLWRDKPARLVILAYGFHAWELLGMWAWLPTFLSHAVASHQNGVLLVTGASLAALTHVTSMAGSMVGGTLSDRWGRTRVILMMSVTSIACGLMLGWIVAAPLWLITIIAIIYNCAAIGDSAIYSVALTEVVPAQHLAAAYSIRSVIGFGMGALSPWLIGLTLDHVSARPGLSAGTGWGVAWTMLAVISLAGPWMVFRLQEMSRPAISPAAGLVS